MLKQQSGVQDDRFVGWTPSLNPAGASATVWDVSNPYWPGAVLKAGGRAHIMEEADMLIDLQHPNIVRVLGVVQTHGSTSADSLAYLALERLGSSLESLPKCVHPCWTGLLCLP